MSAQSAASNARRATATAATRRRSDRPGERPAPRARGGGIAPAENPRGGDGAPRARRQWKPRWPRARARFRRTARTLRALRGARTGRSARRPVRRAPDRRADGVLRGALPRRARGEVHEARDAGRPRPVVTGRALAVCVGARDALDDAASAIVHATASDPSPPSVTCLHSTRPPASARACSRRSRAGRVRAATTARATRTRGRRMPPHPRTQPHPRARRVGRCASPSRRRSTSRSSSTSTRPGPGTPARAARRPRWNPEAATARRAAGERRGARRRRRRGGRPRLGLSRRQRLRGRGGGGGAHLDPRPPPVDLLAIVREAWLGPEGRGGRRRWPREGREEGG